MSGKFSVHVQTELKVSHTPVKFISIQDYERKIISGIEVIMQQN
jgi:hypothetical protein